MRFPDDSYCHATAQKGNPLAHRKECGGGRERAQLAAYKSLDGETPRSREPVGAFPLKRVPPICCSKARTRVLEFCEDAWLFSLVSGFSSHAQIVRQLRKNVERDSDDFTANAAS